MSQRLSYVGSSILYQDDQKIHSIDLAELWFPPTDGHPRALRWSDDPGYVDLALALADRRAIYANAPAATPRAITRQLYLVRNVLDWLRTRGVYRLVDATSNDTDELAKAFAAGGWAGALQIENRWNAALDQMSAEELARGFHYAKYSGGVLHITTLSQAFWCARLGWGGIVPLPAAVKERLDRTVTSPGSQTWQSRGVFVGTAPGCNVVRNLLVLMNDWVCLPTSVDRLLHRVADRADAVSKQLSKVQSTSTANLGLNDAIQVITSAFRMQYELAPLLIELFELTRRADPDGSARLRAEWLQKQKPLRKLSKLVGKPIERWVSSGHHAKQQGYYTVDQILAAVQCGCAIVLTAMNARRQREVCDERFGVRVGDLVVMDDEVGLYQAQFYIEKTYLDRHLFFINRTSADAIRCLQRLKEVCLPPNESISTGDSLFSCGRRTEHKLARSIHMIFGGDRGRTRSLTSFFEVAMSQSGTPPDLTAHMLRRFYAILYFHQYEHADLRALKQHLRHLAVTMTRIYLIDPACRPLVQSIKTKLGIDRFTVADGKLHAALNLIQGDLDETMDEVRREKLQQAVEQVLNGQPTAGGFSRVVRKLYRQMLPRISFAQTQADEATISRISEKLSEHGYSVHPMEHGQCHAPDARRRLQAKCEQSDALQREHAGPSLCHACPYHFNNEAYLENIREDLCRLESEAHDILLPPMQQARAAFDFANLTRLIEITDGVMRSNASAMQSLKMKATATP